jgi:glycosyltransferase involved in cell wall biosynthesis
MKYSVVIPVYNRPQEARELLESLTEQVFKDFEVLVVEDGSSIPCKHEVEGYMGKLNLTYLEKENTGPGLTRNHGARSASGEYLIFFDSDCLIPKGYFQEVERELASTPVDFFGGPDRSHPSFTSIQKAISYSMTSFLTTGGIRGGKHKLDKFQPRSFNMGVTAEAFRNVEGFSSMRYGEDIDLSLRLAAAGYHSRLFPEAFVYHKRRTDFRKFYRQVFNSGFARISLQVRHRGSMKLVHLLPSAFVLGICLLLVTSYFFPWLLVLPLLYCLALFTDSLNKGYSACVALLCIPASWVQLVGYGMGFLVAFWKLATRGKNFFIQV